MIQMLKDWLRTFPQWQEIPFLTDSTCPDSVGLFPRGVQVLSSRRDILGRQVLSCRLKVELGRVSPRWSAAAEWLLQLQSWVLDQQARGLAPRLGEDPQRICLEKGKLQSLRGQDSALYTAWLTAEFTKIYEETENGEN